MLIKMDTIRKHKNNHHVGSGIDKGRILMSYVHYVQNGIVGHSPQPCFSAEQPRDILYLCRYITLPEMHMTREW